MFIIHGVGVYHFRQKTVAFRNDYCISCSGARRAIRVRSFDVGHISWIPILPVGFWKRWLCATCGRNPHESPKTRRSFKWAGLLVLVVLSVGFWADPAGPDSEVGGWIFRIGAPAAAVLLLVHLLRTPKDPALRDLLATVHAAADTVCPFCGTPLIGGAQWYCPGCGVIRC
jgi:hypothetical protein